MRFLKESLLSFFVVGVVLSLYFVAAVAALFIARGFLPIQVHEKRCVILKSPRTLIQGIEPI
jgi:hypothetical protein